jgi:peptide/nickel transport system substrate-binding protein
MLGRRTSSTALAAGSLALVLAACNAGSTSTGSASGEGAADAPETLAVGLSAEPASLDFTTTDGAAIPEALLYNVLETLVKIDSETGEIVPLLAEDYEVSEDGRTYTFTLHEGVTFSNGDEFTAEDVEFSIERVQSDDWTVSLKSAMDVVDSVEVTSPTEVVVTLAEPSNDWLYRMTTRVGAMFSETGVDDLANDPIGTGPYVVADRTRGDSITLETRDDPWGEVPDVEQVVLRYFDDATALNNALLSGGIDVIGSLQSPESLERFSSDDRFQVLEGTTNGELVLSMNNARPPFDDQRVRSAVKHALDRQAILDTTYAGMGELIGSMVPPTDPWYEDLTDLYPHDPEKARQLLAEAGATDVQVAFRIPNLPYAVTAAQVVKSQLAEVGISADIEVLEFPARWLEEVLRGKNYDMSLIAHVEPRDITTFADPEYYWGYDSPEFQGLIAQAQAADEQESVELLQQAARTLAEDAAADWLFLLPSLIVAEKDVQGLPVNRVSESFDLTGVSRG